MVSLTVGDKRTLQLFSLPKSALLKALRAAEHVAGQRLAPQAICLGSLPCFHLSALTYISRETFHDPSGGWVFPYVLITLHDCHLLQFLSSPINYKL